MSIIPVLYSLLYLPSAVAGGTGGMPPPLLCVCTRDVFGGCTRITESGIVKDPYSGYVLNLGCADGTTLGYILRNLSLFACPMTEDCYSLCNVFKEKDLVRHYDTRNNSFACGIFEKKAVVLANANDIRLRRKTSRSCGIKNWFVTVSSIVLCLWYSKWIRRTTMFGARLGSRVLAPLVAAFIASIQKVAVNVFNVFSTRKKDESKKGVDELKTEDRAEKTDDDEEEEVEEEGDDEYVASDENIESDSHSDSDIDVDVETTEEECLGYCLQELADLGIPRDLGRLRKRA